MQQQRLLSRLFGALIGLAFGLTVICLGLSPAHAASVATGSGTLDSPYIISSLHDLQWLQGYLADAINDGGFGQYFRQTADIDLSSISDWTPLGQSASGFRGSYDGQGYIVSQMKIQISAENNSGLFAVNNGTIVGLGVTDVVIAGGLTSDQQVGALAGTNKGTIQRCWATGTIATAARGTGGLVGLMTTGTGTVPIALTDSYSRVDITNPTASASTYVGGLVGDLAAGTVRNSFATGIVDTNATGSNSRFSGGLAGEIKSAATVVNSFSTSLVDGGLDALFHSGLAGQLGGSLTFAQTTAANDVKNVLTGGFASDIRTGVSLNTFKTSSYFTDAVNGWSSAYPWDFSAVWTISATENDEFPTLIAQRVDALASLETTTTSTTIADTVSTTTTSTTADSAITTTASSANTSHTTTSEPAATSENTTAAASTSVTTAASLLLETEPAATETTQTTLHEIKLISGEGRDSDLLIAEEPQAKPQLTGDIPSTGEHQDLHNQTIGCLLVILALLLAAAAMKLRKKRSSAVE